jgi:hypothetical protein
MRNNKNIWQSQNDQTRRFPGFKFDRKNGKNYRIVGNNAFKTHFVGKLTYSRGPLARTSGISPSLCSSRAALNWTLGQRRLCKTSSRLVCKSQSTYIYRVQSSVWRLSNYWPSTSLPLASVSSPRTKGYTLARGWGGGGSIFRKTTDIGLVSYSIIPLRCQFFLRGIP